MSAPATIVKITQCKIIRYVLTQGNDIPRSKAILLTDQTIDKVIVKVLQRIDTTMTVLAIPSSRGHNVTLIMIKSQLKSFQQYF